MEYEELFKIFKKNFIAQMFGISRPTFDKKIKENSFTKEEIKTLKIFSKFAKEVKNGKF